MAHTLLQHGMTTALHSRTTARFPVWLLALTLVLFATQPATAAGVSRDVKIVQTLIQAGSPDKAIKEAKRQLAQRRVTNSERFQLLSLIADAEYIRASAGFFSEITSAVEANKTLLNEFPQRTDGARIRWRIVKLYWKHGQRDAALAASQRLRSIHGHSEEAHQSWMVDAQIYYHLGRLSKARSALLQFSLQAKGKRDQARQLAWTAMVDMKEKRNKQALQEFEKSFKTDASVIHGSPEVFAQYILLLARLDHNAVALQFADDFLARYSDTPLRPKVRLIRADILAKSPDKHGEEATREYMDLSEENTETSLGRQAFMRKLMLQMRDKNDFYSLKPALIAFKKMARRHQMSIIEDEATIDQAILWAKLANSKAKDAPPGSIDAALENFSKAAAGISKPIHAEAVEKGRELFEKYLNRLLRQQHYLQAVALWKRYPAIRKQVRDDTKLGVAHAMRLLTQYDQAEKLLRDLYRRHADTLRGEQIKLEQARLWVDRKSPDGIDKINRWLSEHEFTIYRPELLLLVAQMQLSSKRFDAAYQTIVRVSPDDLVHDLRSDYWKLRAYIAEARKRWHVAAHAWQQFGNNSEENKLLSLRRRALALFKAGDYGASEPLWLRIPKADHDAAWHYYINMSRYHNGKWQQALEGLRTLAEDQKAGVFRILASLALTEHDANAILKQNPLQERP